MKEKEKSLCEVEESAYGVGIRHLQMFCLWLCVLALFMARGSMGVAVLAMSDEKNKNNSDITVYDWDKKTQSVILSSFFWGYVLMQIPGGILAKKYGSKLILLASLLINATVCLLTPTFASLGGWQLVCASRGIMGLSQACLFSAGHTLTGQWVPPKEQTKITGLILGGAQIGTILIMPLSGLLCETAIGWKMIFYTLAGILYVTAAVWYAFSASTPKGHRMISAKERLYIEGQLNTKGSEKNQRIPWKAILTSKPVWGCLTAQTGCVMSYVLFFVDLPTYLEKGMRISFGNSASLSALPYIGMCIGTIATSIVSEKLINMNVMSLSVSRKVFESIALFGTALGLIILSFVDAEHKIIAVILLISIMAVGGSSGAGHFVNQLDLSPNYAGLIMSLSSLVSSFGSVLVPLITGMVLGDNSADITRWRTVFLLHAGNNIICNVVFLIFCTSNRQDWDDCDYLEKKMSNPEEITILNKAKKDTNNKQ